MDCRSQQWAQYRINRWKVRIPMKAKGEFRCHEKQSDGLGRPHLRQVSRNSRNQEGAVNGSVCNVVCEVWIEEHTSKIPPARYYPRWRQLMDQESFVSGSCPESITDRIGPIIRKSGVIQRQVQKPQTSQIYVTMKKSRE